MSNPTTIAQSRAALDHRLGEPGARCYGFVEFSDGVRVGYTTGPEGPPESHRLGDLWQANWGIAFPWHFQAAANILIREGMLAPRDGKVLMTTYTDDQAHLVRADAIDRDITVMWPRGVHGKGGCFKYAGGH